MSSFKFTPLLVAAVLGDTVNYLIGLDRRAGHREVPDGVPKVVHEKTKVFLNEEYGREDDRAGARFFVIVRTFAPFVAGVAKMNYKKFSDITSTARRCG